MPHTAATPFYRQRDWLNIARRTRLRGHAKTARRFVAQGFCCRTTKVTGRRPKGLKKRNRANRRSGWPPCSARCSALSVENGTFLTTSRTSPTSNKSAPPALDDFQPAAHGMNGFVSRHRATSSCGQNADLPRRGLPPRFVRRHPCDRCTTRAISSRRRSHTACTQRRGPTCPFRGG